MSAAELADLWIDEFRHGIEGSGVKPGFEQIEVLKAQGIDPSSFIWVHAQGGSLEGNMRAAKAGAWISLDNVNAGTKQGSNYDISWYAQRIGALKNAGLLHRVLISHDAGWYSPGEENGGDFRGFTALFSHLIPMLEEAGFSDGEVKQLLVENPMAAYSLRFLQVDRGPGCDTQ